MDPKKNKKTRNRPVQHEKNGEKYLCVVGIVTPSNLHQSFFFVFAILRLIKSFLGVIAVGWFS